MPLSVGERLGPYEVLELLGVGGMGEVYQGRDTRLNRLVAIKVSAAEFTERFAREAALVAALNHPNICTLYDVGPNYLVMELIEGPTLADRQTQGAIALNEALPIALQIAEALEAAHEKGIIHRDLKPANIKLTSDGKVKVLDFGLAKALEGDGSSVNQSHSPTLAPTRIAATQAGFILGTAGYMAPEQARGHAVDRRADVWAYGVVLWEMVTGRRMFDGETLSDTLAQVLTKTPDVDAAPARLRPLLRRCLEPDRKKRLQAIGEARIALESPEAVPVVKQKASRIPWPAVAAFFAVAFLAGLWGLWRATRPVERPLISFDVDLGVDLPAGNMAGAGTILSPDGSRIVFMDSKRQLWTRRLDQSKAVALIGTEDSQGPFFSPDGRWLGFFAAGKLKKIMVEGGSAISIFDGTPYMTYGSSWGEDGYIIAALSGAGGLSRVPVSGGASVALTDLNAQRKELTHRWPQVLPGGKVVLFTASAKANNFDDATIEAQTLASGERKTLHRGGTFGRYLPSGHLVYMNRGTMFAAPLNLERLELTGTPVPVLEQVLHWAPGAGYAQLDFSRDGKMVFRKGVDRQGVIVQWLDHSGETGTLLAKPGNYANLRVSPDGKRLAMSIDGNIYVYEWERDTMTRLTFGNERDDYPVWSPDGSYLAFRSALGIWWVRADGANKPERLIESKESAIPTSFTPDGKNLVFYTVFTGTWALPIEGNAGQPRGGKPAPFVRSESSVSFFAPALSPDGKWLAYYSRETGGYGVYVRTWPDTGARWQVSSAGRWPVWSRNGHELYWVGLDTRLMVTTYSVRGNTFVADKPRPWADKRIPLETTNSPLDITPDGKRFAVLMPEEGKKAPATVTFQLNFFDELKRKLAAAGNP